MKQPLLEINNDDQFDDLDILEQERLKQSKVQGWNPDDSLAPPKGAAGPPGGSKAASPKASDQGAGMLQNQDTDMINYLENKNRILSKAKESL